MEVDEVENGILYRSIRRYFDQVMKGGGIVSYSNYYLNSGPEYVLR